MSQLTIKGNAAIVTGAGGGIGSAVVKQLLTSNILVLAIDNNEKLLTQLKSSVGEDSTNLYTAVVDVSDSTEVENEIDDFESLQGPIDLCVNVAGVLETNIVTETTDQQWDHVFDINARGVFNVSRAVARRMVKRSKGAIVTVSSNAAGVPRHGMAAYAASKAAATMFTKSLGLELAPHGIRCNVVAPGSTRTNMQESMWNGSVNEQSVIRGSLETYKTGIPLLKIAEPEDVAGAVLFLLSDQAGHITMTDIYVDGGATLNP